MLANYARDMCSDTPFSCKRGGLLECNLFANVYKVNVAIHQDVDVRRRDGVYVHGTFPTIHLLYHDEHYQLLRYDWPWSQFELLDIPESSNESSNDGFVENRKRWAVNQVDSYRFPPGKDNLFLNLMKGLVVIGASTSSKLSVGGLKSDLMHYLVENIEQILHATKPHRKLFKHNDVGQAVEQLKATGKLPNNYDLGSGWKPRYRGKMVLNKSNSHRAHNTIILQDSGHHHLFLAGNTRLDLYLFANSKNVHVALYEKERESYVRRDVIRASNGDSLETIHLLCHTNSDGDVYFTLFMPKLYQIMKGLRSVEDFNLYKIYNRVTNDVQGRNGLVVDYNPLLTALLGCNTNLLFLGAKEQSRGALFYIGPYINKNGVEVIDALPLILRAQEDVLLNPSVADDTGTDKRHVQHTLTRTLNKLNAQMEVSDTQAAGALLGLDARMTSEIFAYYDGKGYKNYIKDWLEENQEMNLRKRPRDSPSDNADSDVESEQVDADWDIGDDNFAASDIEDQTSDNADSDVESEQDADWDIGDDKLDAVKHEPGEYGKAKIYKMNDETLHAISYPELYRYRGEKLKDLNRLEYCSMVRVVKDRTTNAPTSGLGRKKNESFQFGKGLKIGSEYRQVLLSKQCTPKFFGKMPRHPGKEPSDPSQRDRWREQAEQFAFHYLTMFRPEDELYEAGQEWGSKKDYSWEAFLEFESELRSSDRAVDNSRLELMERVVHAWKVDSGRRIILSKYRGRNRTLWSKEQKGVARASRIMEMQNHTEIDYGFDDFTHTELSAGQQLKSEQINRHKDECVTIMKKYLPDILEGHEASKSNSDHMTLPFDETSYTNIKSALPNDCGNNNVNRFTRRQFPRNLVGKVDKYLKKQDLSSDKGRAVSILREHFTAIYEGRAEDKGYIAPFLLICGGPGNGKSKLVETFDGMSSCMGVGRLVKTAFVGGAAVNINGSSLLGLFDIPVIEIGKGEDEPTLKHIKPWSVHKRQSFMRRFNIENISCIIVDEISTVKPYVLAYLNARLMELYPESSKPFGGRAVVLLGDFDQLPPCGGSSLAGAAMKYEEEECKKGATDKSDEEAFVSGKRGDCVNVKAAGILLFERAKYIKLTQQHRSKDPEHTALLERVSRCGKFHKRDLDNYEALSEQDMSDSGEFSFATMVVTGNAERHELNAIQAKRWASQHNTKVVRWFRKRLDNVWKGKPKRSENVLKAMEEDCFYELFVPGAAGYISENINTDIGLANGVEIKYHSLSFGTLEEDEAFKDEFANSDALIMTLDKPPDAVNVELYADFPGDSAAKKRENAKKRRKWTHGTLVEGRVVVQISIRWGGLVRKWETENIGGDWQLGYNGSTVPMKDYFPIEPAFCVTIWKAQVSQTVIDSVDLIQIQVIFWLMYAFIQGRTIRRLIIFISQHPVGLLRMTWEGLYVALSRVKYRDHIRLAIKRNNRGTVEYISNLSKNKYTAWFFRGYGRAGDVRDGVERSWNRALARKAAMFKTTMQKGKKTKTSTGKKTKASTTNKRRRIS